MYTVYAFCEKGGAPMATAVVSGRVDEAVRQKADNVMRKNGLKPSDVIQNVWNAMAETGEVPEVACPPRNKGEKRSAMDRLESLAENLPPVNPAYADLSDEEILAQRVRDYA